MSRASILNRKNLRLKFCCFVVKSDVDVRRVFPDQFRIECYNLLDLEELKVQLVKFRLDLGRLDNVLLLGIGVISDLELLIALARDSYGQLELTSDLTKGFRLWVGHNDPLM